MQIWDDKYSSCLSTWTYADKIMQEIEDSAVEHCTQIEAEVNVNV